MQKFFNLPELMGHGTRQAAADGSGNNPRIISELQRAERAGKLFVPLPVTATGPPQYSQWGMP